MAERAEYGWEWFRSSMAKATLWSEPPCRDALGLVREIDELVSQILAWPTSPFSERPQDYVVSLLVTRSFRLAVSTVHLSLAGYADSATVMQRTVWEIALRLLDMTTAPVEAASGYLLDSAAIEIGHLEAEVGYMEAEGEPLGFVPQNLEMAREHYADLRKAAADKGFAPDYLRGRHGRLNYRDVCRRFEMDRAYLVGYAFLGACAHEKNAASDDFVKEKDEHRDFEVGPVGPPERNAATVFDVLGLMIGILPIAASIMERKDLVEPAQQLANRMQGFAPDGCRHEYESKEGDGRSAI